MIANIIDGGTEVSLGTIEERAKDFAAAHALLSAGVRRMFQTAISASWPGKVPPESMPIRVTSVLAVAAAFELPLAGAVESAPGLFVKPRTAIFHGVKVGFQKGKGGVTFGDAARVVELIHKHYEADEAAALIRTEEKPDKQAIGKLSVCELRKIGCDIQGTEDDLVIKPTDSDVDKLVARLLADATEDAEGKVV